KAFLCKTSWSPEHHTGAAAISRKQNEGQACSSDGNDGRYLHFRGGHFGLVGDQFSQERNQNDERNTDRESAGAELGEKLRVPGVGGDRRGTGPLRDHARKVASKE